MQSIDDFNSAAARILDTLYSSFPAPIMLDCLSLSGHTIENVDDFGIPPKETELYHNTAEWLIDEGFVRASDKMQYHFAYAVLTSKGLTALNAKVESIDPDKTLGQKLQEVAISGSKFLVSNIIQSIISVVTQNTLGNK